MEAIRKERFRRPSLLEAPCRIRPVFEDFHLLIASGRLAYPRHQHSNYEVILVERGPYRCELNGRATALADGEMLVVKPGDWHADFFQSGQRHFVLHFHLEASEPGAAPPRLFRERVSVEEQVVGGEHGHNAALLEELRREATEAARFAGAAQDALLEALFWRIARHLPERALSPEVQRLPRREAEREALSAAFRQVVERPARVGDVAKALGISSRQLANRCREAFGQSPAKLLLEFKVRRAEELLRYHGLRVQEASFQLGFSNPFHFSRVFRRLRGYPPRAASEVGGKASDG